MGMAGAGWAKVLEPGVGVPQVADRVPNAGTHAGRQVGGRPLAPRDRVPEWGQHQGRVWVVVASQSPHHRDDNDVVIVVSRGVGHPCHLTSVSGRGLPIGARVGVWALDRAGARRLTHYRDGDDDPVVVSHGEGRPFPWARCLTPVWRWRACGWVWAGVRTRSRSCNNNDDVVMSVVGDGRGPGWDPAGVPA